MGETKKEKKTIPTSACRGAPSDLYSSSRGPAAADAITVTSAVIGRGLEKGSKSWCRRCGMTLLRRRCLVAAAAV
jgi:hypothetical protein